MAAHVMAGAGVSRRRGGGGSRGDVNGGDNGMKPDYYVLSFSGGKDSTALSLEWLERHKKNPAEYPLDEIIYCDTTMEFPAMVEHIDRLEKVFVEAGIKFSRLRAEHSFEYYMFEYEPKRRRNPKSIGLKGYSWPMPMRRWCTTLLKIEVKRKHFSELRERYRLIQLIGFAADEQYRLKRKNNQAAEFRYPLMEWGWTEADCLQYCYDHGYDWGGLYKIFHRVSCWCCPLQSLQELRNLRAHFPELWAKIGDMDNRTGVKFWRNYSVDDLEMRFSFEEERQKAGLPVGLNKGFQTELKRKLAEMRGAATASETAKTPVFAALQISDRKNGVF